MNSTPAESIQWFVFEVPQRGDFWPVSRFTNRLGGPNFKSRLGVKVGVSVP